MYKLRTVLLSGNILLGYTGIASAVTFWSPSHKTGIINHYERFSSEDVSSAYWSALFWLISVSSEDLWLSLSVVRVSRMQKHMAGIHYTMRHCCNIFPGTCINSCRHVPIISRRSWQAIVQRSVNSCLTNALKVTVLSVQHLYENSHRAFIVENDARPKAPSTASTGPTSNTTSFTNKFADTICDVVLSRVQIVPF